MNEDTLETAIAGSRKGERWEHPDFGEMLAPFVGGHLRAATWPLDGWHRVEHEVKPEVRCPRCGGTDVERTKGTTVFAEDFGYECHTCGLIDSCSYPAKADARAAWARIGVVWHKPEEKPPRKGIYVVWGRLGGVRVDHWDVDLGWWRRQWSDMQAWADLPRPGWLEET